MAYFFRLEEESKFVFMYALFKLKLIRGKTILFVNSVDRCYKLKLFLEQFGIPVCVLNSELPATSRYWNFTVTMKIMSFFNEFFCFRSHIVGQFNQGIYDVIVASDERFLDDLNHPLNSKGKPKKIDRDREKSKRDKDKVWLKNKILTESFFPIYGFKTVHWQSCNYFRSPESLVASIFSSFPMWLILTFLLMLILTSIE